MSLTWTCPKCGRRFRRVNQRHTCGVGDRAALLESKSAGLVKLYDALESLVQQWDGVEVVTGDRYVLFRTTRIFADMTFMRDALRLVIHLERTVDDARFIKVQAGKQGRVAHVVKIQTKAELNAFTPLLREAHRLAREEDASPWP